MHLIGAGNTAGRENAKNGYFPFCICAITGIIRFTCFMDMLFAAACVEKAKLFKATNRFFAT